MTQARLPLGQQLVAAGKWPLVGERAPRRDDSPWLVHVVAGVLRPRSFTLEELRTLGIRQYRTDIHCVTRWSRLDAEFSGVPLSAVLDACGAAPASRFVSFVARSDRRHSTSLPLGVAAALDVFLALTADGEPLREVHGGPVRIVVPDRYFYKSLKWLERIELWPDDRLGYWERTAGYHNEADPWREQRYLASGLTGQQSRAILALRDIAGQDLRGLAAGGLDLRGLQAQRALLRDADFQAAALESACFDNANLSNAHFAFADLTGASFRGADLEGADFSGANLRGATLLDVSLLGTTFCDPSGQRPATLDASTRVSPGALEMLTPRQQAFLEEALRLSRSER